MVIMNGEPGSIMPPLETRQVPSPWSITRVMHYAIIGLLLIGGLTYWFLKSPALSPMADPRAAEAIALVHTHRASHAPTLLQALTNRVKAMEARGQGVRLGEWRVEHRQGDVYVVSVWVREQGTKQWFERNYVWQADLSRQSVRAVTRPAGDLMPREPRRPTPPIPARPSP